MTKCLRSAVALFMLLAQPTFGAGADAAGASSSAHFSVGMSEQRPTTMKIRFTANGKAVTATLINNAASRDFRSLLPLTLTLEDYAATEKIAYLPRKLSTADAPPGFDPSVGDVTYYAPWGNLAIFHKNAPYAKGLVQLGRIDSDLDVLAARGRVPVTIELVVQP